MKAYKATYNLTCRDQIYEVGKTYQTDTLKICESGLHFCKEMSDTLKHYPIDRNFILIEVDILGDIIVDGDKGVTNKLKVLRIIPEEEWTFTYRIDERSRSLQVSLFDKLFDRVKSGHINIS
jgi:hypothetical protein